MSDMQCYIMIGPLGAGKTTYAKALANDSSLIYLCPDDLWDRSEFSTYSDDIKIPSWGRIYDRIYQCVKRNESFILDSAQATRSSRIEVTGVIRSMSHGHYKITAIHLLSSLEQCLQGVRSRQDLVPESKVLEYYEALLREPPSLTDGYDEIIPIRRDEPSS